MSDPPGLSLGLVFIFVIIVIFVFWLVWLCLLITLISCLNFETFRSNVYGTALWKCFYQYGNHVTYGTMGQKRAKKMGQKNLWDS